MTEVTSLQRIVAGFTRSSPSDVEAAAWYLVLREFNYQDAEQAVVAHFTGPDKHKFFEVGYILDGIKAANRLNAAAIETDVRVAKRRGLIDASWPSNKVLPANVREALFTLRDTERRTAAQRFAFDELEGNPIDPGDVGKDVP